MHVKTPTNPRQSPRMLIASSVPPTPAEEAASSVRWERRGLLRRLVQAN
jgi:hypothetical protein